MKGRKRFDHCFHYLFFLKIVGNARKLETGFRVVINGRTQDYVSVIHRSEKAMAPHSSTLAWKIPWMEEPGKLQSMGSLRVGHD